MTTESQLPESVEYINPRNYLEGLPGFMAGESLSGGICVYLHDVVNSRPGRGDVKKNVFRMSDDGTQTFLMDKFDADWLTTIVKVAHREVRRILPRFEHTLKFYDMPHTEMDEKYSQAMKEKTNFLGMQLVRRVAGLALLSQSKIGSQNCAGYYRVAQALLLPDLIKPMGNLEREAGGNFGVDPGIMEWVNDEHAAIRMKPVIDQEKVKQLIRQKFGYLAVGLASLDKKEVMGHVVIRPAGS